MGNAAKSRNKGADYYETGQKDQADGNDIELKWLFYLCLIFTLIEIIVIYRKYDFLNVLLVLVSLW